jgi:hypothetical protein
MAFFFWNYTDLECPPVKGIIIVRSRSMGDILNFLAELTQPQRLIIAIGGAAVVVVAGLLLLALVIRRARRGRRAAAVSSDEQHTPPYLQAVPSAPTLVIESTGQKVPLNALPLVLGRAPGSGVVLDHTSVSAQHARVYRDPNFGLCIEDLGSLNGLYIDNQLTRRNLLHRDCRLALGEVTVLFHAGLGKSEA